MARRKNHHAQEIQKGSWIFVCKNRKSSLFPQKFVYQNMINILHVSYLILKDN